jgi:hypothetical protein
MLFDLSADVPTRPSTAVSEISVHMANPDTAVDEISMQMAATRSIDRLIDSARPHMRMDLGNQ